METIDLTHPPVAASVALVTDWLGQGGYRVIRPLEVRETYCSDTRPEKLITVAILDTETTGTNAATDKVIELGVVLVEICPKTGRAYRVIRTFNELEAPGFPIPEESTKIHNITDEMVAGKRIVDADVEELLTNVSLVVAHNARFDRPFVEQRFPIFATKAWACSFAQIPWGDEGVGSAKLEFLAYRCGFHYTGHRASTDCHALLEVLQNPLPVSGMLAMQSLLETAREPEIKVSALNSPFETKDLLRERNYRWNAEKRVWAKGVQKKHLEDEVAWLRNFIYGGKGFRLEQETLTAKNRYSLRPGETEMVRYD
jgi:DNA polymerase-3 subunit epsilon